jgi:hypothetical protein
VNRRPRSKQEWDDLARERERDPGHRGSWQVGMVVLLALLVVFALLAFLVPSVATKIALGVAFVLYFFGSMALRRRPWDVRRYQQITDRSITGGWMDAAARRDRGLRRRR